MDKVIEQTKKVYLTKIDNYILDSGELDGMEQITYAQLKKYSSSNNECFPGNQTLCEKLKWSGNTVRRVLRSLEAKGFISIEKRFNDSNKYELLPFPNFLEQVIETVMDNDKNVMLAMFTFYQDNINFYLGSMEKDRLISWFEKFKENPELIIEAIKIAVSQNVKKLRYIEVILLDWYVNEIKTVEQANSYMKSRSKERYDIKLRKCDTFNDYEQREYDYEDLERKLLGWSNHN